MLTSCIPIVVCFCYSLCFTKHWRNISLLFLNILSLLAPYTIVWLLIIFIISHRRYSLRRWSLTSCNTIILRIIIVPSIKSLEIHHRAPKIMRFIRFEHYILRCTSTFIKLIFRHISRFFISYSILSKITYSLLYILLV